MNNSAISEIQNRFEINNALIVNQAIVKLSTLIYEKLGNGKCIDGKTTTIPEIKYLWEKCSDKSSLVADGACKIFISLVLSGQADYMYVVNGFVNQALSNSNSSDVIAALKDVLVLSVSVQDKLVGQLFNLRSPQHPFIRILRDKPDLWPVVLEQTKLMLSCCKTRADASVLSLVNPLLQFVLWDPARCVGFSTMRLLLLRALVDFCRRSPNLSVQQYLRRSVFWLQVNTAADVTESSFHLKEIAALYCTGPTGGDGIPDDDFVLCMLATCLKMTALHLDVTEFLETIERLVLSSVKLPASEETRASTVLLSLLLVRSLPVHQGRVIKICTHLLARTGIDPVVSGTLYLPLIVILNIASSGAPLPLMSDVSCGLQAAALELLTALERTRATEAEVSVRKPDPASMGCGDLYAGRNFCVEAMTAFHVARLAERILAVPGAIHCWLRHARRALQSGALVSDAVLCLASSVLVHGLRDVEVVTHVIDILADCGKQDLEKAPSIFAVFLYKLRTDKNAVVRMHLLKCIPLLGIHKPCTTNILHTFLALGKSADLKAFAIHLISLLWQNQDRIFPHFHKLIVAEEGGSSPNSGTDVDEVLLAKAAAILDICRSKPHLYGAELLTILSKIILSNIFESGTSVTVLALESIISLCKVEVIDLRTTWRFLAPKLKLDKRPLVKRKLCEFLSLTESLRVETAEYERFISDSVYLLWHFAETGENAAIVGDAYRALSNFDNSRHSLKFLPKEVKSKVKLPSKMASTPYEASQKPEDVLQYVPGSAYLDLLMLVPLGSLKDYGELLCALVRQEVRDMPRSILYLARTGAFSLRNRNLNEMIGSIPSFMVEQHESRLQPSLIGSVALGLLLSYRPQTPAHKEGNATRHSMIQQGKAYDNMMETLLMQASLEISDWRKTLIIPSAWSTFMERVYFSMVQARISSLDLQQQQQQECQISSEEFEAMRRKAWLWTRDKICDTLKRMSRSKSSFHGNALLALTGLAAAVTKYSNLCGESKPPDGAVEAAENLSHKYWLSEAVKAVVNVLDPVGESETGPFSWCRPAPGSSGSIIVTYATLAVNCLAPILVNWDVDVMGDVLMSLYRQLSVASSTFPMLQFCSGLSLGQFISSLVCEHYFAVGGDEGKAILLANAEKLRAWCFDGELDTKCGGLLGLSMMASSLCRERCLECGGFVLSTLGDYEKRLNEEPATSLAYDVLLIGRVLVTVAACGYGLLPLDAAEELFAHVQQQANSTPNSSGKATAYGLLLQYLASADSKRFLKAREDQLRSWTTTITSKSAPTLAKLASVNGAFSLFPTSLESTFLQGFDVNVADAIQSPVLADLVNVLRHVLSSADDAGVQNCSAWMLGSTYFNLTRKSDSMDESVDYSYLRDESVLKPVVDFVIAHIRTGLAVEDRPRLAVCLKCLAQVVDRPYPTLHWPSLVKPLLGVSDEIQELLMDVVVARTPNSASACALLTSWMCSSTMVLAESCRIKLFNALHRLIHFVSAKTVQVFLERNVQAAFTRRPPSVDALTALIKGIILAVRAPNPPAGVIQVLHLITADIFRLIDPNFQVVWDLFCELTVEVPDEILDQMTAVDGGRPGTVVKVVKLRCRLVGNGKQPLNWLNECVDAAALAEMNTADCDAVKESFLMCFKNHSRLDDAVNSSGIDRVNWLLGMMGHIRNVMDWHTDLPISDTTRMKKVVARLFHVFALSVIGWCGKRTDLQLYCWTSTDCCLADLVMDLLPGALARFVAQEPWNSHVKQIFEWLLLVCKSPSAPEVVHLCVKACFLNLRHCPEFKKASMWTRVAELEGFS